jgi:hypothetical protein
MRIYILVLFFVSISAAKCSDSNKTQYIFEILSKLNNSGKKWISLWGYKELKINDILQTDSQHITYNISDGISSPDFFRIYSENSMQSFIDIYSGTFYIDSSKESISYLSEPESIVKLWRNDSLYTLLHYGYSIVFQDAFWINKDAFIVVGYEIGEDNIDLPKVWLFDLSTKKLSTFDLDKRNKINDDYLINRVNKRI